MRSTLLTQLISYGILAIYILYGLSSIPFIGVLLSLAVGLLVFGTSESTEVAAAITIVVGVVYALVYKTGSMKEGFSNDSAEQIVQRVAEIKKEGPKDPKGLYASTFVEGFANADTDASGNQTAPATTSAQNQTAPATGSGEAGSGIKPPAPPAAAASTNTKQGFKGDSGKDMEFKLGVIPGDEKGGYHIDQGTTVINALNALKPDQIQAMTQDTQKLIETQKSLMSMLGTMKPMLQDGKQMMANFQEMFGNGSLKM